MTNPLNVPPKPVLAVPASLPAVTRKPASNEIARPTLMLPVACTEGDDCTNLDHIHDPEGGVWAPGSPAPATPSPLMKFVGDYQRLRRNKE